MKDAIDAAEESFRDLGQGNADMPLRPTIRVSQAPGERVT
jgi:hypothetical protein